MLARNSFQYLWTHGFAIQSFKWSVPYPWIKHRQSGTNRCENLSTIYVLKNPLIPIYKEKEKSIQFLQPKEISPSGGR